MIKCHIDNNTGGFSPIYGQTRNPFQISFYLVGILFLVFDIELLMSYPYAVCVYQTGQYGFWIFAIFFFVLTIGFVYEFGKGALYFTDKRSSITTNSIKTTIKPPFYLFKSAFIVLLEKYIGRMYLKKILVKLRTIYML